MFRATTDRGSVSVRVEPGAYMDAAATADGKLAGLEFAASEARIRTEGAAQHAPLVVTVDFDRTTGQALALLLAAKMGLPAFNEREWREIADNLRTVGSQYEYATGNRSALLGYAVRIETAYKAIA